MKIASTGQSDEAIAQERERCRQVFRKAYGRFRSLVHGSKVRVQNPENFGQAGGGIHFDAVLWMRDFRLVGIRILHGVQYQFFEAFYLDELGKDRTMYVLGLRSRDSWGAWRNIIEEKMGSELERAHLWPPSEYAARSRDLYELIHSQVDVKYPKSHRLPDMDGMK